MAIMHIEYFSKCLSRLVDVRVLLPVEDLTKTGINDKKYPTLYLLHGYSGHCSDWLQGSCIAELARMNGIAVVMPDGENSFYEDNEDTGNLYSKYVGEELVELTRSTFPLMRDREHTWIAGYSMGGFGALYNGFKYADTFGAVACLSGAYILDSLYGVTHETFPKGMLSGYGYYRNVFGDLTTVQDSPRDPKYWLKKRAAEGNAPRLYLACGTEDFLYKENIQMREFIRENGLTFAWDECPGIHDWGFWDPQIRKVVPWLLEAEQ